MKKRLFGLLTCLLALTLLAGCSSIAPKEKTIILSEKAVQPEDEQNEPFAQSFDVGRINKIPLDKLNPTGDHPDVNKAVIGWIDNDNLAAMSVQTVVNEEGETAEPRIMTQFLRIHSRYGFYDPVLTLGDVAAECFDLSADGSLAAYVAGNRLDVYSLGSGTLVQTLQRQVLASRVTFAQEGHDVYFTEAGDEKLLERLNADNGVTAGILSGKSYRVLAASGGNMVVCTQSDGAETLSYLGDGDFTEALLDKKSRAASCRILSDGAGLVAYGGDLYLMDDKGVHDAGEGVTAFDIGSDGMHIAYAQRNADGTVDIRIGYWSGSRIINDKLTYKDIGVNVSAMYFSPQLDKLYLQGRDETGQLTAYTFEFQ